MIKEATGQMQWHLSSMKLTRATWGIIHVQTIKLGPKCYPSSHMIRYGSDQRKNLDKVKLCLSSTGMTQYSQRASSPLSNISWSTHNYRCHQSFKNASMYSIKLHHNCLAKRKSLVVFISWQMLPRAGAKYQPLASYRKSTKSCKATLQ